MSASSKKNALVIGAGPAGLTAALELLKNKNFNVTVLEKNSVVGGISRTTEYKGCKFDIGPHHFLTESEKIDKWWKDIMVEEEKLGNKFLTLSRFTRIYYKKHYFYYPLQPINALLGLNIFESTRCVLSYLRYAIFPIKNVKSFQDWVTNRFGYRLFSIFFKTYSEKVWGIPCTDLSADWASQRIKNFSLFKAIFYAFFGRWFKKNIPRTISDKFYYPMYGAGTLWNRAAIKINADFDGQIFLNKNVDKIKHDNHKILSVLTNNSDNFNFESDYFFSSMPIRNLILAMDPIPPIDVVEAAKKLSYRSFITVNFIVNKKNICPDHWLYIHDKDVYICRIGNMNNFSIKMVDIQEHTALDLEYFMFETDDMWKMSDEQIISIGKKELEILGLVKSDQIIDGMVLREDKAYPVYDPYYKEALAKVLEYLKNFTNLQLIGRNGLHRYDGMDSAMLSAMAAVDKVIHKNLESFSSLNL